MAMVSLVFAEYLGKALWQEAGQELGGWWLKGVGLSAVWGITWLNCLGTSFGTRAASFFLVLKLVGLGSVVVVGVALMIVRPESTSPKIVAPGIVGFSAKKSLWSGLGSFTDAILAALFAYGGWESVKQAQLQSSNEFELTLCRLDLLLGSSQNHMSHFH